MSGGKCPSQITTRNPPISRADTITTFTFPEEFLWGATTTHHAVEGGDSDCDWAHWEQRPGRIRDDASAAKASGHYERFDSDFALAGKLGLNALFLTLSWSRIQPAPGVFDENALAHYRRVLESLHAHGIKPCCALHHVTQPAWFAKRGGWAAGGAAKAFSYYAQRIALELGSLCSWWVPVYEPEFWLTMACRSQAWPGGNALFAYRRAFRQLVHAHGAATAAFQAHAPGAALGVSVRGAVFEPTDLESAWDLRKARDEQARWNHRFLVAVKKIVPAPKYPGFIGISYYGKEHARFSPWDMPPLNVAGRRWGGRNAPELSKDTYPQGLLRLLNEMNRYKLPMLITGNGIATSRDEERCDFLLDHLNNVVKSMQQGVGIRGYFHRAFLDGFEWCDGYAARYGLVHVDRDTLARTPNPSAFLFRDISQARGLRPGAIARYCPGWTPSAKEAL